MSTNETMPRGEAPDEAVLTVFHDGSCPLCSREIGFYRACRGSERIAFVDVSAAPPGEVAPGLSREQAMRRFHVMDRSGQLIAGGRAFAALWRSLPGFALIGRLFASAPAGALLDLAYRAFLPIRPILQRFARRSQR